MFFGWISNKKQQSNQLAGLVKRHLINVQPGYDNFECKQKLKTQTWSNNGIDLLNDNIKQTTTNSNKPPAKLLHIKDVKKFKSLFFCPHSTLIRVLIISHFILYKYPITLWKDEIAKFKIQLDNFFCTLTDVELCLLF